MLDPLVVDNTSQYLNQAGWPRGLQDQFFKTLPVYVSNCV
jgi:hypothetical protein